MIRPAAIGIAATGLAALTAVYVGYATTDYDRPSSGHEHYAGGTNEHGAETGAPIDTVHAGHADHGMVDMDRMPPLVSAAAAGVEVQLVAPRIPQPGTATRLTYRLADASGAPITDVVVSHEQPMHLIVTSRDLAVFQHLHPQPTGQPGEYAVDVTFPTAGTYVLYDQFARSTGQDILKRDELVVGVASGPAALAEDVSSKTLGAVRVDLHGDGPARVGEDARLIFRVADARTGQGLSTLKPYLGAAAHVIIMSEDGQTFAHTHGMAVGVGGHHHKAQEGHGGHGAVDAAIGPEIAFRHTFPAPGLYKIWGQLQADDGQVITADFTVRVGASGEPLLSGQ